MFQDKPSPVLSKQFSGISSTVSADIPLNFTLKQRKISQLTD